MDPGYRQTRVLDELAELVVDLETMPVPLGDVQGAVGAMCERALLEGALVRAQPHRGTLVLYRLLLGPEVDDGLAGPLIELGRLRA